jgi:hypothetical protein
MARAFLSFLVSSTTTASTFPSAFELVGRLHFPLLHFPIALLFAAALLEIAWRRGDSGQRRAFIAPLLWATAVSAVATVVAGLALADGESFDGAQADTFLVHRGLGIATAVSAVALVVLQRRSSRAYRPLLAMSVVAVSVVGHLGGELVHGAGYLTRMKAPPSTTAVAVNDDDERPRRASDGDDGDDDAEVRERRPEGLLVERPDYATHIKPLFERSCVKCHGPEKRKSGLRLDQKRYALKGGESGPTAIVPGDASKSLVFTSCAMSPDEDGVMPPRGKLLALSEIETLKRWIDQGAVWPDEVAPSTRPKGHGTE